MVLIDWSFAGMETSKSITFMELCQSNFLGQNAGIVFHINHGALWVIVSSCMWSKVDCTFLKVCNTANRIFFCFMCLTGSIRIPLLINVE